MWNAQQAASYLLGYSAGLGGAANALEWRTTHRKAIDTARKVLDDLRDTAITAVELANMRETADQVSGRARKLDWVNTPPPATLWRPMHTAPRDGSLVLLVYATGNPAEPLAMVVAGFSTSANTWIEPAGKMGFYGLAWQPLPEPPALPEDRG